MSELARIEAGGISVQLSDSQLSLLKNTVAAGCDNNQFDLFTAVCANTGLDPFARQIFPVLRKNRRENRTDMTIQVGIDGLRLIAQRTGEYEGQGPLEWCGNDGKWVDIWLKSEPPAAARASVYRAGFREPLVRTVLYKSYCQSYDGKPTGLWKTMGEHMLAKCAEAAAIRAAFPQETSGIYTRDEMMQADNRDVIDLQPEPTPAAAHPNLSLIHI